VYDHSPDKNQIRTSRPRKGGSQNLAHLQGNAIQEAPTELTTESAQLSICHVMPDLVTESVYILNRSPFPVPKSISLTAIKTRGGVSNTPFGKVTVPLFAKDLGFGPVATVPLVICALSAGYAIQYAVPEYTSCRPRCRCGCRSLLL